MKNKETVDQLVHNLKSLSYGDWNYLKCMHSIEQLVKIGAQAVEPLIEALGDPDYIVRSQVIETLGQIGDARAVTPLIKALKDEYSLARAAAAYALGQIGDKRAVEPIIEAWKDEALKDDKDNVICSHAADALGMLGDKRAVEPLIEALKDDWWVIRHGAAVALGMLGDKRAVEPLIEALKDEDKDVRMAAAEALENIKVATEAAKPETQKAGAGDALGTKGAETGGLGGPAAFKFLHGKGGTGIPGLGGIAMLGKHKTFKPFKLAH